jgi:hypothetical protein
MEGDGKLLPNACAEGIPRESRRRKLYRTDRVAEAVSAEGGPTSFRLAALRRCRASAS